MYFDRPSLEGMYLLVADWIAEKLEISAEKKQLQIAAFEEAYFEVISFPEQEEILVSH